MSVSIVRKSEFGNIFARLDAEYVEKTSLEQERTIQSSFSGARLATLLQEKDENEEALCELVAESEGKIRYLSIDSVDTTDGLSFETDYQFFEDLPSRAQHFLETGDILVSNVRPNRGAVTIIRSDQEGVVASSGFTLVRLGKDSKVPPEYLFALLKTPIMRDQLVRRGRGSMYPAVLRSDVLDLFIPFLKKNVEKKVVKMVVEAMALQKSFFDKKLASSALLNEYLFPIGFPPSPMQTARAGVDWTEVASLAMFGAGGAQRLDAEFFRNEYLEFDLRCQDELASFHLGLHFELAPGRALKPSADKTYYAKQGMLTNVGLNWSVVEEAEGSLTAGGWTIQKDDILLACTAHEIAYIGRKVDVVSEVPDWIQTEVGCVPDLMILRRRQDDLFLSLQYVAAFLRHPAGLHQVQRCIRGLRGGHVYKADLERFVRVPLPSEKWMRAFDLIETEAETIRNRAKNLIESAIKLASDALVV